jgi:hypothetical protein
VSEKSYVVNVRIGNQYVPIPVMKGEPGKTVQLRFHEGKIEWKYTEESDSSWRFLFDTASIEAVKGDPGITPHIGANGNWFIGETDTGVVAKGAKGDPGYTPQKGKDYWTDADISEIKQHIFDEILNEEW